MNNKIAQIVTEKIIKELENGNVIWRKTWKDEPISHQTKKVYSGFNYWRLILESMEKSYSHNLWLTYKQTQRLEGNVKKGEHGTAIIFYRMIDFKDKDQPEKIKSIPLLRYFNVWNISQCEKIDLPKWYETKENAQILEAESIYKNMPNKPPLKTGSNKCAYNPKEDILYMPDISKFETSENYYTGLYHELTHSTGNEKRLNRNMETNHQAESYAKEELIAEMGSSILNHHTGINNEKIFKNTTAYIQGWLKALKDDNSLIISASSQAEKAVKYILNELE